MARNWSTPRANVTVKSDATRQAMEYCKEARAVSAARCNLHADDASNNNG